MVSNLGSIVSAATSQCSSVEDVTALCDTAGSCMSPDTAVKLPSASTTTELSVELLAAGTSTESAVELSTQSPIELTSASSLTQSSSEVDNGTTQPMTLDEIISAFERILEKMKSYISGDTCSYDTDGAVLWTLLECHNK